MLLVMLIMYLTAKKKIRDKNFELFWYLHQGCGLAFFILLFTHAVGCFVKTAEGQCKGFHKYYILMLDTMHIALSLLVSLFTLLSVLFVTTAHTSTLLCQRSFFTLETRLKYSLRSHQCHTSLDSTFICACLRSLDGSGIHSLLRLYLKRDMYLFTCEQLVTGHARLINCLDLTRTMHQCQGIL